jgi:hypothetical protein
VNIWQPDLLLFYYCCEWLVNLAFDLFQLLTKTQVPHLGGTTMASDVEQHQKSQDSQAVKPATKIKITEDADATGATAAAYDYWRAGSGRQQVPGIIKCFGARPDFLQQVVQFSNTIHFSEGHLARRHKEMIASYVSYLNRCPY